LTEEKKLFTKRRTNFPTSVILERVEATLDDQEEEMLAENEAAADNTFFNKLIDQLVFHGVTTGGGVALSVIPRWRQWAQLPPLVSLGGGVLVVGAGFAARKAVSLYRRKARAQARAAQATGRGH
jgi:hypothetical protein